MGLNCNAKELHYLQILNILWKSICKSTGCPKKLCLVCGCCGRALDSIISNLTQLRRSVYNLEFETLNKAIWQVVADLSLRKCKINGCFKHSTSIVLQQCRNTVCFQSKGSSRPVKIFAKSFNPILVGGGGDFPLPQNF